ncbi:MAG: hypothetical protein M3522_05940 [Actinomycetota bacterium]|nr:hypothetical protein [Actinomycetota bacterium]
MENAATKTHAAPIDLGFEASGVGVTSLHGDGPSIIGADAVHYLAPGYFPKVKERPGRRVEIFAVLPRSEERAEELDRSYEPDYRGHRNPYVVPLEARVCENDAVYYEGDYPEDAVCLVVGVSYPDERSTPAFVLRRPLPECG